MNENNFKQDDVSTLLPILKKIPLFENLDKNLHKEIIKKIMLMFYPKDYVLFKEGDEGDALYIIKSGEIEIYKEPKEEGDFPEKIAEISKADFLGEMALVSEVPRNASAKTLTDCEVFIIKKEDFNNLMNTNKNLAEQISSKIIERLKENDKAE